MARHIKSVTLNGVLCIHHVRHLEHTVHCMEHPVHRKYPNVYVLLAIVPIEPFIKMPVWTTFLDQNNIIL